MIPKVMFCYFVGLLAFSISSLAESPKEIASGQILANNDMSILMAATSFHESKTGLKLKLNLWKQQLISRKTLTPAEEIQRAEETVGTATNSEESGLKNIAIVLVKSPDEEAKNGQVCLLTYDFQLNPWDAPLWAGDVIWDPVHKTAFVIISRSKNHRITLTLYKTNPESKIASFPLEFDPIKEIDWPKETPRISEIKRIFRDNFHSGIKSMKMTVDGDTLLIAAERFHRSHPAINFRFDLSTQQWSVVSSGETQVVEE